MSDYAIEIDRVSLAFNAINRPELEEIHLLVQTGEFVSLVGPSGCGKSTLLRMIAGVLSPTSGQIQVPGHDGGWSKLSFVPQDSLLLPWRTVLENIVLPLELKGIYSQKEMIEKAKDALNLVNLTHMEHKYPSQLSGGMRQRAALARALVENARILLLDEPFAALDALTRSQLHLELLRIHAEAGITIFLVTHNIFEAVFLSDKVVVMGEKPGRTLGEIPISLVKPRELKMMASPHFSRLVGAVQDLLASGWEAFHER